MSNVQEAEFWWIQQKINKMYKWKGKKKKLKAFIKHIFDTKWLII